VPPQLLRLPFAVACIAATAFASGFTFTDLHPAGSSTTLAFGINDSGTVIGWWCPAGVSCPVAYVDSGGSFTTLPTGLDYGFGINDAGVAVGQAAYYQSSSGTYNYTGYEYSNGTVTTIADPNGSDTTVWGISNNGLAAGSFYNSTLGQDVGFVDSNGSYSDVSDPLGTFGTDVYGINNSGEVVGDYYNNNYFSGFFELNGVYTTIGIAGAEDTFAYGINDAGQIVGEYVSSSGIHGFLDIGGVITTIDDPNANGDTVVHGISDNGELVGEYVNSLGNEIAFTATPNATPEPGTASLLIGAALLAAGLSRRRG
jgi:uncharacterized membrane protein